MPDAGARCSHRLNHFNLHLQKCCVGTPRGLCDCPRGSQWVAGKDTGKGCIKLLCSIPNLKAARLGNRLMTRIIGETKAVSSPCSTASNPRNKMQVGWTLGQRRFIFSYVIKNRLTSLPQKREFFFFFFGRIPKEENCMKKSKWRERQRWESEEEKLLHDPDITWTFMSLQDIKMCFSRRKVT